MVKDFICHVQRIYLEIRYGIRDREIKSHI